MHVFADSANDQQDHKSAQNQEPQVAYNYHILFKDSFYLVVLGSRLASVACKI